MPKHVSIFNLIRRSNPFFYIVLINTRSLSHFVESCGFWRVFTFIFFSWICCVGRLVSRLWDRSSSVRTSRPDNASGSRLKEDPGSQIICECRNYCSSSNGISTHSVSAFYLLMLFLDRDSTLSSGTTEKYLAGILPTRFPSKWSSSSLG